MIGTLACWSPQPIFAQTDVTETYLKNPSFENQFTDWENSGMQSQTNTSFQLKEGNTYVERWTGQGGQVADCHVSQTLTTLKNGVYKLTAAAQNIQQNSPATQSGAYVFAGNAQVAVGAANDYSLEFTVIEGQATIGFKTENATGNWVACDNFRLYALNNDLAEIQEELQRRIEKGQALVSEKMQKDVLKELNAALEAARQELNSTTDDNMAPVAIRLRQATEAAQTSIHAYQELQAAIDKSLEAYGDGTLNGAAEFHAVIQEAQALAENLDANAEDLATAVEKLGTALLAFRIANPTGDTPAVVTDTRYARGSTMAFGRSTITGVPETELVEHGFCWSTEPEPTILDNRTTEYIENNGHIYVLRNLTPSTIYYIRAYALTKGYAVGYGDAIKVITKRNHYVVLQQRGRCQIQCTHQRSRRFRRRVLEQPDQHTRIAFKRQFRVGHSHGRLQLWRMDARRPQRQLPTHRYHHARNGTCHRCRATRHLAGRQHESQR